MSFQSLTALSEKKALKVFGKAASKIPAYKKFLEDNGIHAASIHTIEDFKKLPLLDKTNTFLVYGAEIKKLCLCGELKDISSIAPSSGAGSCFSYGLNNRRQIKKSQETVDAALDSTFDTAKKKTLLVNCLPMGVRVPSNFVTVVDTSVRADIVISVVRTFAPCYDQTIIVGENSFIKKVLEDGLEAGLDWKALKPHLILGEEILPENLRTYFADILGIDPDDKGEKTFIGSSFGIAEFGLNIFYETKDLIRIRRLLRSDFELKKTLIAFDPDNLPVLFNYNPLRIYAEEIAKDKGLPDIVLTNLEEATDIPLVRYNIKDEGLCIPFKRLKEVLSAFGYEDYIPKAQLPLVALWGRDKLLLDEGFWLRPEFIKEILYEEKETANGLTGNFRISKSKAGLRIEIQSKMNSQQWEFENKIRDTLFSRIPAKIEIIVYTYREFPHNMELNYEKKFKYVE